MYHFGVTCLFMHIIFFPGPENAPAEEQYKIKKNKRGKTNVSVISITNIDQLHDYFLFFFLPYIKIEGFNRKFKF